MSISSKINTLKSSLPEGVELVAVSKFHASEAILEAYGAGQRIFGESRVQELLSKVGQLPNDIEWRMIGHLQRNKVKQIIPFISLIESVDSERLLQEIERCAQSCGRRVDVLLQLNVTEEQTKEGWQLADLEAFVKSGKLSEMTHIRVRGVMGMATNTDDEAQIKSDFAEVEAAFQHLKKLFGEEFNILSMGMSGDYELAIESGSNSVRIGSSIFGSRT